MLKSRVNHCFVGKKNKEYRIRNNKSETISYSSFKSGRVGLSSIPFVDNNPQAA